MPINGLVKAIGSCTCGQTYPRPIGLGFDPYQDILSWYMSWLHLLQCATVTRAAACQCLSISLSNGEVVLSVGRGRTGPRA